MRALLFTLVLSLISVPGMAQTIWSKPYEPNQIAVETFVPDGAEEASVLSGATFVSATASLSENVELAAEVPFAQYDPSTGPSSSAIGNPFLGLGLSSTTVPLLVQLGTRLPVAPANSATRLGQATDVGRTTAFQPEELAFSALLNGRGELSRNSTLRLRSGVEFSSRPSQSAETNNRIQHWRLYYDAQLWREGDRLLTGLSFGGRALLTSPGTVRHHAAFSFMGNWNRVQPGLFLGTSVNDLVLRGQFSPLVGLTLSVSYGRF